MMQTLIGLVISVSILVPGHVYRTFRARYLVIPAPGSQHETILSLVVSGMWNLALTWPVMMLCGIDPLAPALAAVDVPTLAKAIHNNGVAWMLQLLVAPVFTATAIAYINRKGWTQNALTRLGLFPQLRHASAWDAAFYHVRDADVMVAVLYKDKSMPPLYGRLGANSAASPGSVDHGVYVDAVYIPDAETGDLVLDEETIGHYIPGEEIGGLTFMFMPELQRELEEEQDDATEESTHG